MLHAKASSVKFSSKSIPEFGLKTNALVNI